MLAARRRIFLPTLAAAWKPLVVAVLVALVAVTAARAVVKAQKLGRTGEQSRTAFLRWRLQIHELDRGADIYRAFNYPNPPIMALILKPLAALPATPGMLAWFALKTLMAVGMALLFFRLLESGGARLPDWAKLLAIGLSLHPILGDLSHGNVNLFIAFLIALGLDCYRREKDLAAGLVFALAIACKITPALFVPYFVWKKAWRTLIGLGLGLILWWAVVPGAVLGFDFNRTLLTSWFEVMVKPFAIDGQITSEHPNQSLPGLLTRLLTEKASFIEYSEEDGHPMTAGVDTIVNLGPAAVQVIVKSAMLIFAGAIVLLARAKQRSGLAFAAECGMIVLGMLLFSERTWKHHATTLLLPMAVLIAAAIEFRSRWLWALLAAVPLLSIVPSALGDESQNLAMVYGAYTIMYGLLLAGMIVVLIQLRRATPAAIR